MAKNKKKKKKAKIPREIKQTVKTGVPDWAECFDPETGEVVFFYDQNNQIIHPKNSILDNAYHWKHIGYYKAEQAFIKYSGEKGSFKTDISKELGIFRLTLKDWLKKDRYLKALYDNYRAGSNDFVLSKLMERIKGYSHQETKAFCYLGQIITLDMEKHYPPDIKAIQTYLQLTGKLIDKKSIENNVSVSGDLETSLKSLSGSEIEKELKDLKNILD